MKKKVFHISILLPRRALIYIYLGKRTTACTPSAVLSVVKFEVRYVRRKGTRPHKPLAALKRRLLKLIL